eukprot:4613743-Prymnesium_polylepis.1
MHTVFRGCKQTPADVGLELVAGFDFTWAGFSSTATTQDVMSTFVGQEGSRTLMTIELTEPVGRDLRDFSLFPTENEVLFPPNVCFEVVAHVNLGHGLTMVQCKQTETIDAILDMTPAAASTPGATNTPPPPTAAAAATAPPLPPAPPTASPAFAPVPSPPAAPTMPSEAEVHPNEPCSRVRRCARAHSRHRCHAGAAELRAQGSRAGRTTDPTFDDVSPVLRLNAKASEGRSSRSGGRCGLK